jgi:hypothetical protein
VNRLAFDRSGSAGRAMKGGNDSGRGNLVEIVVLEGIEKLKDGNKKVVRTSIVF